MNISKVLFAVLILGMSACSIFHTKPDTIYVDKLVKVYPSMISPVNVIDSNPSIYNPISGYVNFQVSDIGTSFTLRMKTYGFETFRQNGEVIDVIKVDSMQYAELIMSFNVLMTNHIFTKRFLELYRIRFNKIEDDKDLQ